MSADALKCTWGDSYITDTQNASWTSTGNAATIAVYSRGMVTVTRANEFLKRTGRASRWKAWPACAPKPASSAHTLTGCCSTCMATRPLPCRRTSMVRLLHK